MPGLSKLKLIALAGAIVPVMVLAANIVGTAEPDVLEGTPDDDTINGKGGADTMMGLPGNDTYFVAQPDDEVLESRAEGLDVLDLGRAHRQLVADPLRRAIVEIDVAREPAHRELHGPTSSNCRRNRTSPPMNKRMSSIP